MSRVNALSNIDEAIAYFADRSDVVDGDYGQPQANEEMIRQSELEEARDAVAELIAAAKRVETVGWHSETRERLSAAIARIGGAA